MADIKTFDDKKKGANIFNQFFSRKETVSEAGRQNQSATNDNDDIYVTKETDTTNPSTNMNEEIRNPKPDGISEDGVMYRDLSDASLATIPDASLDPRDYDDDESSVRTNYLLPAPSLQKHQSSSHQAHEEESHSEMRTSLSTQTSSIRKLSDKQGHMDDKDETKRGFGEPISEIGIIAPSVSQKITINTTPKPDARSLPSQIQIHSVSPRNTTQSGPVSSDILPSPTSPGIIGRSSVFTPESCSDEDPINTDRKLSQHTNRSNQGSLLVAAAANSAKEKSRRSTNEHRIVVVGNAPVQFDVTVRHTSAVFPPPPLPDGFVLETGKDQNSWTSQTSSSASNSAHSTPRGSLQNNISTGSSSEPSSAKERKISVPKGVNIVGLDKIQLDVKPRSRLSVEHEKIPFNTRARMSMENIQTNSSQSEALSDAGAHSGIPLPTTGTSPSGRGSYPSVSTRKEAHQNDQKGESVSQYQKHIVPSTRNSSSSRKFSSPYYNISQSAGDLSLYTIPSSPLDEVVAEGPFTMERSRPHSCASSPLRGNEQAPRSSIPREKDVKTSTSKGSVDNQSVPRSPEMDKATTPKSNHYSPQTRSPLQSLSVSTATIESEEVSKITTIGGGHGNSEWSSPNQIGISSPGSAETETYGEIIDAAGNARAKDRKEKWFSGSPLFRKKTDKQSKNANNPNTAQSPSKQLFANVVFCFSGIVNPNRAEIRSCAMRLGAKYCETWTDECTHLICASGDGSKWKEVMDMKKAHIVRPEWVLDTLALQRYLPESLYAVFPSDKLNFRPQDSAHIPSSRKGSQLSSKSAEDATTAITTSPPTLSPGSPYSHRTKAYLQKQSSWVKVDDSGTMQLVLIEKINSLPDFFKGIVVVFDDTIVPQVHKLLQRHVIAYDGQVNAKLSVSTTHYCTERAQMDSIIAQISKDFPHIRIVSTKWIFECHASGRRLPIEDFRIS